MDPQRHMYSFENNRYTPMSAATLHAMMEEGKKPALNQDGIHNLMSLYEVYPDEPTIHESREDGFYHCRATVKLISFRSGQPMGAGTGSCSTRESKYAYRWIGERNLPKGLDRSTLRQREMTGRNGPYVRYRLDNEDVADVEATVLQMAVKRAKSAAVKALPLVSEMFAAVGDADEDINDADAERQDLLKRLGEWLRSLKSASGRAKALMAVFGEPLKAADLQRFDVDQLAVALQVIERATVGKIDWNSATLLDDLRRILHASAQQAKDELFGDAHGSPNAQQPARDTGKGETSPTDPTPTTATQPEPRGEPVRGQKMPSPEEPSWKLTLRAHRETLGEMARAGLYTEEARESLEALCKQVDVALSPLGGIKDTEGFTLASAALEWIEAARDGA